jgi:3-oxoacyl-[acyl-carrier-protein] synthase-3
MSVPTGIIGTGMYVPPKCIKNDDFAALGLDTSHQWIVERTGIEQRYVADASISSSDMGIEAAKQAIQAAGIVPGDIDLIVVATSTPDYLLFPSTACLIQDRLGIPPITAFDVSAACSGFSYALTTASQFVATGQAKHALVVATDCLSKYIDWTDRSICVLFGDGAGAAVVSEVKPGYGIVQSQLQSDGSQAEILMVKGGGSRNPLTPELVASGQHFIYMNGKAVFKVAVDKMIPAIEGVLKKAGIGIEQLALFIPHQANIRIIQFAADRLGLQPHQVFANLQKYGNTSAASIPIALHEAVAQGRIKEGDYVLTMGFGAGFTWGINLCRWGGKK